ncbi:GTPase HflX [Nymphon striatum]|nr:GTPase HflX [Nymphon striatum]
MVYLQVTRGVAKRDHVFPSADTPSALVVTAKRTDQAAAAKKFENGVGVITVPENRWDRVDIKSTGLLPNCMARQKAKEQGCAEAWFIDEDGMVKEGGATNAWIVTTDGTLVTRPAEHGILRGITRATAMDAANKIGLKLEERYFSVDEAKAARESFITAGNNTHNASGITSLVQATLLGSGKVSELAKRVKAERAELVVVDHALTPVQQRNLEKELHAKVVDRTGLILEIFGRRARTKEGVLQVELAHLNYQRGRLVRSWTHLERQRGGAGFLGGPGETQIEADRRILRDKIKSLENELESVRRTRTLHRSKRKKIPLPVVAFVGYTNAGKSTLFNRLTGASVHAEDMLFATLDPTLRRVQLPSGTWIILSDTVGFISDLPTAFGCCISRDAGRGSGS